MGFGIGGDWKVSFNLGYNKKDFEKNKQDCIDKCEKHNLNLCIKKHGIASRINQDLIINENMFNCTEFYKGVIDHEIRHSGGYTKKDLGMDLFEGSFVTSMAFCLRFPGGFSHFIPIGKHKKQWFVDMNQIIVYLILTGLIWIIVKLIAQW